MSTYREITLHRVEGLEESLDAKLVITADAPDPSNGGASHDYTVAWTEADDSVMEVEILFQRGPIKEHGVNGISLEALLAVCIDRLECFQNGTHPSSYNQRALEHLREALGALQERTKDRLSRGVEGTSAQ